MLENEPEGGERTGSQPAGDTADQSTTADGAAVETSTTAVGSASVEPAGAESAPAEAVEPAAPVRRARATRRRAAPLNQPEQTDAPIEAPTGGAGNVESPQAEVFAPVSGDLDVAPKTPGAAARPPPSRRPPRSRWSPPLRRRPRPRWCRRSR